MGIAENLKRLRAREKRSQPALARMAGVSQQLISQLERGENTTPQRLPEIARALNATVYELDENFLGDATGPGAAIPVPVLSMVSAGALMRDDVSDEARGSIAVAGLGAGDWIALEVEGTSMDRISPPGSRIVVNRRDKRLVPNACYIIADEDGSATYKRYRPNPDRFEPVSTFDHPTLFPDQDPAIVGRVKWSILEM